MTRRKILLLLGSPRGVESASEGLGRYLRARLEGHGTEVDSLRISTSLRLDKGGQNLVSAVEASDAIVLITPLYVDSAPALVIRAMELIAPRLAGRPQQAPVRQFAVLCNCGFAEAQQNQTSLDIYRCFAEACGLEWIGGLALGMGEVVRAYLPHPGARMIRNVLTALDLAAEALADGAPLPAKAIDLMARRLMPVWLFRWMGGRYWARQARQYGMEKNLLARPDAPESEVKAPNSSEHG